MQRVPYIETADVGNCDESHDRSITSDNSALCISDVLALIRAFSELSSPEQKVFILQYFGIIKSPSEIALQLGLAARGSAQTVQKRLNKKLARLNESMLGQTQPTPRNKEHTMLPQIQTEQTQDTQIENTPMQTTQGQNEATAETVKVDTITMTQEEEEYAHLVHLRLSSHEIKVFLMFWIHKLFPDQIALQTGNSIDEVIQQIVEISEKIEPIADLFYTRAPLFNKSN